MNLHLSQLKNFYVWAIKGLIFIIPFLPLWIAKSMFFPYIAARNFGFRFLVEIALIFWLGLMFADKSYRPRKSWLLIAIAMFTIVVGFATIFAENPYYSFWSRFERMDGYITILHLAAYFLILGSVFRSKKDWLIFFNILIFAGIFTGFYGISQKLGLAKSIQGGFRIDGTIGNPTYFAAYLILALTVSFLLLASAKQKWAKYYYGAVSAFFLLIIYFTASRGPILGLMAAVLLSLILYFFLFKPKTGREFKYKKIVGVLLLLAVILPIGFWAVKDTPFVRGNPILNRFATISLTEKTTRSRFMVWEMAWRGFLERPLLGWGQEGYVYVFNKYYNPKMWDQEPWFDRAHNIVLDWLVNAGILGLLAYLFVLAAAFWMIWTGFKKGKLEFKEMLVLFAGLVAYFIQNLLVFDSFNTYFIFFALLAYIHFRNSDSLSEEKLDFSAAKKLQLSSLIAFGAAALVVAPAIYFGNIKPLKQNQAIINLLSSSGGSPDVVLPKAQKILAYDTFGSREALDQILKLAMALLNAPIPDSQKSQFVVFALEEMEKQIEKDPTDLRARLFIMSLYNRAAPFNREVYLQKSFEHGQAALAISPARQTIYFILSDVYFLKGDFQQAVAITERAVALEPKSTDSLMNLVRLAVFFDRFDVAEPIIAEIRSLASHDAVVMAKIGQIYLEKKNYQKAREFYEIAANLDALYGPYRANLAYVYTQLGMKDEAIREAKLAAQIDPPTYTGMAEEIIKTFGGQ